MEPRAFLSDVPWDGLSPLERPQLFHVLAETPCPYLPDRRERKVMTEIWGPGANKAYSRLSRAGFRRSHNFAYRPACSGCAACVPIRVVASAFEPSRSMTRVMRANQDLIVVEGPAEASEEQYRVFDRYIRSRHGDGDMARMTYLDYRSMIEESRLDTRLEAFRDRSGRMVALCLVDWLEDGPSAVYSFFDPTWANRSLGTYMVLWLIEEARRRGLNHVYLGYWIAESRKMAYKARFRPVEGLGPEGWQRLTT